MLTSLSATLGRGHGQQGRRVLLAALVAACFAAFPGSASALTGAIFTTDLGCGGVNINLFVDKGDVYLNGGPAGNGPGLPEGDYYAEVTDPNGISVLGKTLTASVHVNANGSFAQCYRLSAILVSGLSGFTLAGYDDSPNNGDEYKVAVSPDAAFPANNSKTDNFKVRANAPTPAQLHVRKFYDANANGINDDGQLITGWKVRIQDNIDYIRFTPIDIFLDPDTYTVTEFAPLQTNWVATTSSPVVLTIGAGQEGTATFGNLCLGAGGGLTLGYWSNKNGQAAQFGTTAAATATLAFLSALNLRNADGSAFDPTTYAAFRTWLLGATATNMAYMLSAQLAAMKLNVRNGNVNAGALIYAPGTTSANALGFATVNAVMAEADGDLATNNVTTAAGPARTHQEALKNALDKANNNLTFVQATPCAFTFSDS
jgi:hypothetical protein